MAVNLFPGSWNGSVSLSFGTALQSTWGWVNSQRQEAMVAYGYYIPNWSTWLAPKWQDWIPTMIVTHLPWATLPGFSSRALSGLLPTHGQPLQWSSRRCLFPTWTSQQKLFGTLWRSFEQCPGPSFSRLGGISHFERLIGRFVGFVCLASRIAKFAGMMIVMRLWMLITRRGEENATICYCWPRSSELLKTPVDCGRPVTEVHAEDTQVLQQLLNKVKLCPNCQPLRQHRGRGASPGSHWGLRV